jgi:hypothetical protein
MAEQIIKNAGNAGSGGNAGGTHPQQQPPKSPKPQAQDIGDQTMAAGRDLKDRIAGLAESSADAARAQAESIAEAAKEFAAEAGETIKQRAYSQKEAGADYVGNIADAIRRASREFDNDLPIAGVYMRKAAAKVEDISDTIQQGDLSDLVRGVQDFARRQPTAFLGLAVLAGFGAVRFLKSSGTSSSSSSVRSDRMAAADEGGKRGHGEKRGYYDDVGE